jgi:hypothetical protein
VLAADSGFAFDVEFEAGINLATGIVFATFQSIDPTTGLPPDVLAGFLPPEDGTGRGKGFFSYTITPNSALATDTQIKNVALISFDGQDVIATNQRNPFDAASAVTDTGDPEFAKFNALNTIDNTPPTAGNAMYDNSVLPNKISCVFSEDVSQTLALEDIVVQDLTHNTTISPAQLGLMYDTATKKATVSIAGALADGNYRVVFKAGGIADPVGNPLASDFSIDFFVLSGDANHDGQVDTLDFTAIAAHFNQQVNSYADGDFNYDGVVNALDFNALASHFGSTSSPSLALTIGSRLLRALTEQTLFNSKERIMLDNLSADDELI